MLHLDEARHKATTILRDLLGPKPKGTKAVLIDDLFGRLRVVLWCRKKDQLDGLRQQILNNWPRAKRWADAMKAERGE